MRFQRGGVFRLHNAMHEPENDLVKDGSAVYLDPWQGLIGAKRNVESYLCFYFPISNMFFWHFGVNPLRWLVQLWGITPQTRPWPFQTVSRSLLDSPWSSKVKDLWLQPQQIIQATLKIGAEGKTIRLTKGFVCSWGLHYADRHLHEEQDLGNVNRDAITILDLKQAFDLPGFRFREVFFFWKQCSNQIENMNGFRSIMA